VSLRAAINAKCKDCIYDPLAGGTWRAQVEGCTCRICPLWPVRPKSTKAAQIAPQPDHETVGAAGQEIP